MSDISRSIVLRDDCSLGQIDFINCLPITTVLLREKPDRLSLQLDTPGALNSLYRTGHLDLGAMSSHFYLEDGGFELFPSISIAARGPVGSVLFFARNLKDGMKIAVPSASASSVSLLQILLAEKYGITARIFALDQPGVDADADGFLTFGDSALLTDHKLKQSGQISAFERIDLAQCWFELYKLPMVFGVWAARRSWKEKHPQDFAAIAGYLAGAAAKGLGRDFPAVLQEAARRTALSSERLTDYYLKELDYSFTAEHAEGLELYRNLCKKHGQHIK
ncbi:MAG: menaquinone biosynthesis protein [Cyanobacteria bacterium SZAS LIN-2]|nr:menaquinone biosynthesis protein [Cyanobacteria bacterium SZAS LIN-3]MBS1994733.1 menaquinone biosynthesis protein [Cyanobacteria bacterium SZAS LIN-2]